MPHPLDDAMGRGSARRGDIASAVDAWMGSRAWTGQSIRRAVLFRSALPAW